MPMKLFLASKHVLVESLTFLTSPRARLVLFRSLQ